MFDSKNPIRQLWIPFWLNAAAALVNVSAIVFGIWMGTSYFWIANIFAGSFSVWMALRMYREIPERKRRLQEELVGYLKGTRYYG
jgi:uncharacterized membrane protein YdjX (TVP38/TMEM64 family)